MILSVIIVSYNVKFLLEECLQSVEKAIRNLDAEVIIADNASADGSLEYLRPRFPSFVFIGNKINEGFAKANNRALRQAKGEFILFLNPDTVVPADCFEKCIAFMNADLQAGALGVKMFDGKGRFLKESKRGLPTPIVSLWKLSGLAGLFPQSKIFARYYLGHLDPDAIHEVDVLSGAFMFIRKNVLDITGGFDERFFMYAEDIDLSFRIMKAGYKNYYFPETSIVHYKGESTVKDSRYVIQFYRAMSQFVKKHYGKGIFSMFLDLAIWMRAGLAMLMKK